MENDNSNSNQEVTNNADSGEDSPPSLESIHERVHDDESTITADEGSSTRSPPNLECEEDNEPEPTPEASPNYEALVSSDGPYSPEDDIDVDPDEVTAPLPPLLPTPTTTSGGEEAVPKAEPEKDEPDHALSGAKKRKLYHIHSIVREANNMVAEDDSPPKKVNAWYCLCYNSIADINKTMEDQYKASVDRSIKEASREINIKGDQIVQASSECMTMISPENAEEIKSMAENHAIRVVREEAEKTGKFSMRVFSNAYMGFVGNVYSSRDDKIYESLQEILRTADTLKNKEAVLTDRARTQFDHYASAVRSENRTHMTDAIEQCIRMVESTRSLRTTHLRRILSAASMDIAEMLKI